MNPTDPSGCRLLDDWGERSYRDCVPFHVTLELTLRCNLRCVHCYNFDRDLPRPAGAPELSFEEILRLLDDLRASGTLFLSLTGGEAMAHPRFWDVMDAAAERRFAVTLLSNGTLLTRDACARLATYPNLWGASLSLYGGSAATHDALTQAPGSFRRTLDAARDLKARDVAVWLKFVLMRGNAAEAESMRRLAEAEDVVCSFDAQLTGRYDGTQGSLAQRVDPAQLRAVYAGPLRDLLDGPGNPDPSDDEFKCLCARGNAAVMATGDVYPCIATPLKAGNVREQPFPTIWKESPVFHRIRGLKRSDFQACDPCDLKAWCRRSPSPAVVLHGDFTGIDPWICREAEILRDLSARG
jgi:radical SAM protein with 4Fe4S-binding SPASM domain